MEFEELERVRILHQATFVYLISGPIGIRHLHISHNTPCLPPKILHKHCFQFLLGRLKHPGELKNRGYAKFWGEANKVYCGRCANGELENRSPRIKPSRSKGDKLTANSHKWLRHQNLNPGHIGGRRVLLPLCSLFQAQR